MIRHLLDTNASGDFLQGILPGGAMRLFQSRPHHISVISKIELLSQRVPDPSNLRALQRYIDSTTVLPLDDDIVLKSAELRRTFRLRLPDAVIAATALLFRAQLYSNNTRDFIRVPGLKLIDPRKM